MPFSACGRRGRFGARLRFLALAVLVVRVARLGLVVPAYRRSGDEPANPASCAYCLSGDAALPYDGTADDDDAFPQPQRPSPSRDADAVSSTAVAGVNGASSGGSSHDVSFVTLL